MRSKILLACFGFIFTIAALGYVLWASERLKSKGAATLSIINRIYISLFALEDREPSRKLQIESSPEARLNENLATFLSEVEEPFLNGKREKDKSVVLVDAFDTPIRVIFKNTAAKEGLPDELIGKKRTLIIYSFGQNRKDDKGKEDDIYWAEP